MTIEAKDLPEGFIWKNCTGINARIAMPYTWFFREELAGNTWGYFFTRECIATNGIFHTGLSLNAVQKFRQTLGIKPSEFAKKLEGTPPYSSPLGQLQNLHNGNLAGYSRDYNVRIPGLLPRSIFMRFCMLGNDQTETLYTFWFETPMHRKDLFFDTAQTMLETMQLDEAY